MQVQLFQCKTTHYIKVIAITQCRYDTISPYILKDMQQLVSTVQASTAANKNETIKKFYHQKNNDGKARTAKT